jgi:hypothetical protein
MLPPGHAAAGFLVATVVTHFYGSFSIEQTHQLLWLGAFLGFAPDLDMFVEFWKLKSFTQPNEKANHRLNITHKPIFWLAIGLTVFFVSNDPLWKAVGLLLWLGPWSHFVLDSLQYGIQWLWPMSKRFYGLSDPQIIFYTPREDFFGFWLDFIKWYITKLRFTFISEIVILVAALLVILR